MIINGRKISADCQCDNNTLYCIHKNCTVQFLESDTDDIVNISFCLDVNQYGVFAKEFRPGYVNKVGCKKADILVLVIDEHHYRLNSWVLDVKKSVGGEDVVYHLIEQLLDSIKHKNNIISYLENYTEREHIGYVTREYQPDRIEDTLKSKYEFLKKEQHNLTLISGSIVASIQRKLLSIQSEISILDNFLQGKIIKNDKIYYISPFISNEKDGFYVYNLDADCKIV